MSGSNEHSGSGPEEYDECPWARRGKWAEGDSVWANSTVARRDDLLDGGLQTRDRATEQRKLVKAQRKLLKAQRKLTDGPYRAQGVEVSGVKSATILFAIEAQGRAHQDETREILCENSRLQVVSEGKPHRGRAMDGNFRCAASPDER
jgi:hypothetical protein